MRSVAEIVSAPVNRETGFPDLAVGGLLGFPAPSSSQSGSQSSPVHGVSGGGSSGPVPPVDGPPKSCAYPVDGVSKPEAECRAQCKECQRTKLTFHALPVFPGSPVPRSARCEANDFAVTSKCRIGTGDVV